MMSVLAEIRRRQRKSAERNKARLNEKRFSADHFKTGELVMYYGHTERDAADSMTATEHQVQPQDGKLHRKWLYKARYKRRKSKIITYPARN